MYNIFSMTRMLKDKLVNTLYYRKEVLQPPAVTRMKDVSHSFMDNISRLCTEPTEIAPRVFLGNAYNASNFTCLQDHNVGLIINITFEIPNYFEDHFQYMNIQIDDVNGEKIGVYFDNVNDTIQKYLTEHTTKTVLIHCFMGSSRSAALACAYNCQRLGISVKSSLEKLVHLRPVVNVNTTFVDDLHQWENNRKSKKIDI